MENSKDLTVYDVRPKNMAEVISFANLISQSGLIPKQYQGKPQDCVVAISWGYEIGLKPLQALSSIAVINGKPSIYGDSALALVQRSGLLEYIDEQIEGDIATCELKRKGMPNKVIRTFSMDDATQANLSSRGVWGSYPKRMLQMRARSFALRDAFPDVLGGLYLSYESDDIQPTNNVKTASHSEVHTELQKCTDARFESLLPRWVQLVVSGKKTVDDIINSLSTKSPLTDAQIEKLKRAVAVPDGDGVVDVEPKEVPNDANVTEPEAPAVIHDPVDTDDLPF